MDMHIGEMNSTVRVTDSQSLVSPQVLDRIVQAVLVRLNERAAGEQRRQDDTRLSNDKPGEQDERWS